MKTIEESELLSWKAIWQAVKDGKRGDIIRAIDQHVHRYPEDLHDEVRLRAVHIVRSTQRAPEEVAERIRRVSRTIRILQRGRFTGRGVITETSHAN